MGAPGQVTLACFLLPALSFSFHLPSGIAGWGGKQGWLDHSLGIPHRSWSGPLEQKVRR